MSMNISQPRKVMIFTSNGFVGNLLLNQIIPNMIQMGIEPIICDTRKPERKNKSIDLQDIEFYEYEILNKTIFPFLKSSAAKTFNYSLDALKKQYGIKVLRLENVNSKMFLSMVKQDSNVIGGISIRNFQIFKEQTISVFREKGFLWNLHPGLLPRYRGLLIPYRVHTNGDDIDGWTLHEVNSKIDQGRIVSQASNKLQKNSSVLKCYINMMPKSIKMILESLQIILQNGYIETHKNDVSISKYCSYPTPREFKKFKRAGIFFTTPDEAIDLYMKYYAPIDPRLTKSLKLKLVSEIRNWQEYKLTALSQKKAA